MRNPAEVHTGDDWTPAITLTTGGSIEPVPSGATVRAAITDQDGLNILAGPVTVLEATSGSDWANGVIVPIFPAAQTVNLPTGYARIEIEVLHDGNVSTWSMSRTPRIEPGTITNLTIEPAPGETLADINAAELGSGSATDGYVLTADGAGGADWEAATGGLTAADIDTLAELNAIVADATLIDAAALATVATSGDYTDLINPPTIPTTALPVGVVSVSASKTLALTDANTEQVVDAAGAVVLTIPTNAAVAFATGTKISTLGIGTGTVTITASAGVTLNGVSAGSATLTAQYSAGVLTKVGADAWVLNGDRGAVA